MTFILNNFELVRLARLQIATTMRVLHIVLLSVLAANVYLFQFNKFEEILDTTTPFVPMRPSVAFCGNSTRNMLDVILCGSDSGGDANDTCPYLSICNAVRGILTESLDFKPSESPRWWLFSHLVSVLALLVCLVDALSSVDNAGKWERWMWAHFVFVVLILLNVHHFGSAPLGVAVGINIGFVTAMTCAQWLARSRPSAESAGKMQYHARSGWWALYIAALGFPAYAEHALYLFLLLPRSAIYFTVTLGYVVVGIKRYGVRNRQVESSTPVWASLWAHYGVNHTRDHAL